MPCPTTAVKTQSPTESPSIAPDESQVRTSSIGHKLDEQNEQIEEIVNHLSEIEKKQDKILAGQSRARTTLIEHQLEERNEQIEKIVSQVEAIDKKQDDILAGLAIYGK